MLTKHYFTNVLHLHSTLHFNQSGMLACLIDKSKLGAIWLFEEK